MPLGGFLCSIYKCRSRNTPGQVCEGALDLCPKQSYMFLKLLTALGYCVSQRHKRCAVEVIYTASKMEIDSM